MSATSSSGASRKSANPASVPPLPLSRSSSRTATASVPGTAAPSLPRSPNAPTRLPQGDPSLPQASPETSVQIGQSIVAGIARQRGYPKLGLQPFPRHCGRDRLFPDSHLQHHIRIPLHRADQLGGHRFGIRMTFSQGVNLHELREQLGLRPMTEFDPDKPARIYDRLNDQLFEW